MAEIRRVRRVGGSLTVTIPKEMGFVDKEYVTFDRIGDSVILKRIVS